jgi:hypothetical protein
MRADRFRTRAESLPTRVVLSLSPGQAFDMAQDCCGGLRGWHSQHSEPVWDPLVAVVGERLAERFMWMHEDELDDGSALHAYKHCFTRRYLHLTEDRQAYEPVPCGRFVPLRLDFAIESAVCPG